MINQSNESSILHEEYQIQEAITEFTVSIINQLRLELRPHQVLVDSLRNLLQLFQHTEDWINVPNIRQATWSRLAQYLRNPKRLIGLLQNHRQYNITDNIMELDYTILESRQCEASCIINKIICSIVQFHANLQELSLLSDDSLNTLRNCILTYDVPQVSQTSTDDGYQNTNSSRAQQIMRILQEQLKHCRVGEYEQCFQ